MLDMSQANAISEFLNIPIFPNDAQKTKTARRLFYASLLNVILILGWAVLWVFVQPDRTQFILVALPIPTSYVVSIGLIYLRYIRVASIVFLATLWLTVTIGVLQVGGTFAPAYSGYILVLIWAVIFSGWRATVYLSILTFAFGLITAYLMNQGVIGSGDVIATPTSAWLTHTIIVLLLLYGIYILVTDVQQSLEKTQNALLEREKVEIALRESEERFRLISEVTSDYTFSSKLNGDGELTHLLLTGAFEAITGYTPDEYMAMGGWRAALYPDDIENDTIAFETVAQNQSVIHEVRTIRKDGDIRWVRVYASPVWDEEKDKLIGINGGVQDITKQKELETEVQGYTNKLENLVEERTAELQHSKDQLELILTNISDAVAFTDSLGNIMVSNPAFHQAFKKHDSQSIEHILWSLSDERQIITVSQALLNVIYGNETQRVEAQIIMNDEDTNTNLNVDHVEAQQNKDIDLALIPVNVDSDSLRNGVLLSGRDITQAKDIERFKARFVDNAVHDMAAPISGLSTRLYMLERDPERLTKHVRALGTQVQHLSNLLEDLRTLSEMDRHQIDLNIESHNINQLVIRAHDIYEPVAIDKQQDLTIDLDDTLPEIQIDRRQIERVILNLVSNAVNYTPAEKSITVTTTQEDQYVVIRIVDQGIGISEEDLKHIFERFFRTPTARNAQANGTGLGLAICKEIIELHGGMLKAQSALGEGSTFTVYLPL